MKAIHQYHVVPRLPEALVRLKTLAYNFYFSWHPPVTRLFQRMNPQLWDECGRNPVLMLGRLSQERLEELAADSGFVSEVERLGAEIEAYVLKVNVTEHLGPLTPPGTQIAYFSAEFGLDECLPIYSGGLGILSGDHLKSASDLALPLCGVGLMYRKGYFHQYLNADGWQQESTPVNDFLTMPVEPVRDQDGRPFTIHLDLAGEDVAVIVWRVKVGRIDSYLLCTNLAENSPSVRDTTDQLYGGDREMRLRQEIVLGVGGVRVLEALGLNPTVIHLNEGHSAFSILERINVYKNRYDLSFDAAREVVTASTVFTTHTPVPAGNDVFEPGLFLKYFEPYAAQMGISPKVLLGYGRINPRDDQEPFGMTTLALRLTAKANGVSRLHGRVSRRMWQNIWPRHPVEDIPISSITNGVHIASWISPEMHTVFERYLGPGWMEDPDNVRVWEGIDSIPDAEMWRTHELRRERLVAKARVHLRQQLQARGAPEAEVRAATEVLNPDCLTIGFARRFATYKRAVLLLRDVERLKRLITNPKSPVQFIFAGKAHPQDHEGKEFIKRIVHLVREEPFRRRVVFLEDYDFGLARHLLAGCDVWLNNPRRPLEACGTSGMKALANGVLNLSVLDGWWDEAYHPDLGWAIGHGEEYDDPELQDHIECQDLYNHLEQDVVPLFYDRNHDGVPRRWLAKVRQSMRRLCPQFNAHRMVEQYAREFYFPCSQRFLELTANDMAGARDLAAWRSKIMVHWNEVKILGVEAERVEEKMVGEEVDVHATVILGALEPGDVSVDLYFGLMSTDGQFLERETRLMAVESVQDGAYVFAAKLPIDRVGRFGFTVRIMPGHERLMNPHNTNLLIWASGEAP
ncbi:MAG: alpha-glucan family phosphorylase [Proteobacteria bacterium]|nr:alpha-glucan family phosphorylase [Pseudomonadota bacterium]MBU1742921.1 alpha-glucan family phosphorylase [Pseudomonadota bacterium]